MSKSNYLENALLSHELGHSTFTRPATHYFALFTAAPNDAGGGTEISGSGYARASATNDGSLWSSPSGGSSANALPVQFPEPSGSWGTATHFGIFDAASGGNLLRWGALTTPRAFDSGFIPFFPAGSIVISED